VRAWKHWSMEAPRRSATKGTGSLSRLSSISGGRPELRRAGETAIARGVYLRVLVLKRRTYPAPLELCWRLRHGG